MVLALYGAGAMGREFKYVADETGQWPEAVFIDDHASVESLLDCPVVSFRFHDDGWDSITQMSLVCRLEEAFGISFKGRETMKITSCGARPWS